MLQLRQPPDLTETGGIAGVSGCPLFLDFAAGIGALGRLTELKHRLLFVLGALFVYRIGAHVPVPGIDPVALAQMFEAQRGTILDMFNMFSGGALERMSLFALGIMPYISASIIMQMMAVVVPSLEAMKKEGEAGRRKITQYTRYGTLFLALFQSFGAAMALPNQNVVNAPNDWNSARNSVP